MLLSAVMKESNLSVSGIFLVLLGVAACTETSPADTSHQDSPVPQSSAGFANNTAGTGGDANQGGTANGGSGSLLDAGEGDGAAVPSSDAAATAGAAPTSDAATDVDSGCAVDGGCDGG